MKRIFLSHPFAENPQLNSQRVNNICDDLVNYYDDVLPISPLHLFSYFNVDRPEYREEIISFCTDLMMLCDEIHFYKYGELSKGQKIELNYAKMRNLKYEIINK